MAIMAILAHRVGHGKLIDIECAAHPNRPERARAGGVDTVESLFAQNYPLRLDILMHESPILIEPAFLRTDDAILSGIEDDRG